MNKINPETPKQKAAREKENAANIKRIKEKLERRKYDKLTENITGFANKAETEERIANRDAQFTFTFGIGFISVIALGFLSGFFFGRRILQWDFLDSMIVCVIFGVITMIVESILLIFRMQKFE